jgi:hypothetical protein
MKKIYAQIDHAIEMYNVGLISKIELDKMLRSFNIELMASDYL